MDRNGQEKQRNGKAKSLRAQKRKGDAGVSDVKQRQSAARQSVARCSNGNAKRCLALKWRWNCTDSHGTATEVYRPDNHSGGKDKAGLETHRKCIAQSSSAAD